MDTYTVIGYGVIVNPSDIKSPVRRDRYGDYSWWEVAEMDQEEYQIFEIANGKIFIGEELLCLDKWDYDILDDAALGHDMSAHDVQRLGDKYLSNKISRAKIYDMIDTYIFSVED